MRFIFIVFYITSVINLVVWKDTERAFFCLFTIIAMTLVEIYNKEGWF